MSTKNNATIDVQWVCFYTPIPYLYRVQVKYIHIRYKALVVIVQLKWVMRETMYIRTSNEVQTLTLFSYLWKPKTITNKCFAGEAQDYETI